MKICNLKIRIKIWKNAKDKIKGKTLNKKGSELMIKKIAWDACKNTGDINAFLELKQIENIEKGIENNSLNPSLDEKGDKVEE